MTIDLTPIVALLSQLGPWGVVAAGLLVAFGPRLVPLLQKLLSKVPGGVPVAPVDPTKPATPVVVPDSGKDRPILDALGKLLLDVLAKRAKAEGKTVEAVLAEYVADEVK